MKPLVIAFLCLFALPATAQTASDRDTILAVMQRQVAAWNSGDIPGFMAGYAQSDSLRFASGGKVTYGWQTMLERYRKGYPTKAAMGTLTFTGIDVSLLSPDAALVFGTWRLKRDNDEPWGLFSLLFRKRSGLWRIVHDHTSSGT